MAGGQPVDVNGYRFTARPLSRWRRFTGDFLPYWQGSRPRFILTVTRLGSPVPSQTISWHVRFAGVAVTSGQVVVPPLQTGDSANLEVGGKFLGVTGDILLTLPTNLASPQANLFHTVYAFHTTPKTWIFLTVIIALLTGAVAVFGQWLLSTICD